MQARDVIAAGRKAAGGWSPRDYNDHLVLQSDHVLVAADVHIPKHDDDLIERMLDHAQATGVKVIIWLGDLLDMEEFSAYGIDDPSSTFQRNARIAGAMLNQVYEMGFEQVWTLGNHEARLSRTNKGQIGMEQIALMAGLQDLMDSKHLLVSDNPSVYLPTGNWLLTHPSQYGNYPTVVAGKLATRYNANVVTAHEHHWGMSVDETGNWMAISTGGLFDPRKHKYINHAVTAHRSWTQGYVIIHQGQAQLYRGGAAPRIQEASHGL